MKIDGLQQEQETAKPQWQKKHVTEYELFKINMYVCAESVELERLIPDIKHF